MYVVVGGCRHFNDYDLVRQQLDIILQPYLALGITVLSGHCSGVDLLAERYAEERGYPIERHAADWARYGRAAGPIRNEQMVVRADCIIAFWDGKSRGTKSLISYAQKHGKELHIVSI